MAKDIEIGRLPRVLAIAAILCFAGLFTGCESGNETVAPKLSQSESRARHTWDAVYLSDAKVGYTHTITEQIVEDGKTLIKTTSKAELTLRRFGAVTTTNQIELSSVTTPQGQLVRFDSKIAAGQVPVVTRGQVRQGKLHLETISQGQRQTSSIPWDAAWGGFDAVERSLEKDPLAPGERRTIRSLVPLLNQMAETLLEALDYEDVRLLTGTRRLLKINAVMALGNQKIESYYWVDRKGRPWKSLMGGMKQETFRTTKEIALRKVKDGGFDLGEFSVVKVSRSLKRPHQTRRIVYRARIKDGDPRNVFLEGPSQDVKSIDKNTAEVTVRAIRPDRPRKLSAPQEKPTKADLAPNNLIQSDDPRIVAMAGTVAADETDPWTIATQIEALVRRSISSKNFSQAFATAAEVADKLEGDCTEHAVLLAALCRARNIPARVAIGLVYYEPQGGFAYHMWNEVWIDDRWVPLDGTLGRGGIGAAHLKLAESNLHGAGAYSAFLPVIQVLGRLSLEIVEVAR